jgi:hypothetical protein
MQTISTLIQLFIEHFHIVLIIWFFSGIIGYLIRVMPGEEHHQELIERSRFLSRSDNPEFWEFTFLLFLGTAGLLKTLWNWIFKK